MSAHRAIAAWRICVVVLLSAGALTGCSALAGTPAAAAPPSAADSPTADTSPSAPATPAPVPVNVDDYMTSPADLAAQTGNTSLIVASFDSGAGTMHCGIYSNWWTSDPTNGATVRMFGCRMESGYTFTYPETANPGGVGGCPSGFTVTGKDAPQVLCNSGLVFFSELQTAKTLPEGASLTYDGVTCVGVDAGVTCTATDSGHGFTLTASHYDLF